MQYATLAGDTRTANLAGEKAVDLAPKAQRKEAEQLVKQAKTPPQQGGAGGAQGGGQAPGARTGRLSALRLCTVGLRHRTRGET